MHQLQGAFMKLKVIVAVSALFVMSAVAQAQQGAPPNVPAPTVADVKKVVQIVSSDKAKTQAYCDIGKLNEQMAAADQKKDQKTLEALGKQADALAEKIGPEYIKLMEGLEQVDPNSPLGKQLETLFAPLDKLCGN
jgi:hypothetical protein